MARGSYTETALSAVAGRVVFAAALAGMLYAGFFQTPRVFVSTHVAHFAGFYVLAFASAAAANGAATAPTRTTDRSPASSTASTARLPIATNSTACL